MQLRSSKLPEPDVTDTFLLLQAIQTTRRILFSSTIIYNDHLRCCLQWFGLCLLICESINVDDCSRTASKHVRAFIIQELLPLYEGIGVAVPSECRLHLHRDVFSRQEDAMYMDTQSGKWSCEICGKQFYEQRFILLHMNNRHNNTLHLTTDSLCLADMCDIFRCDVLSKQNTGEFWDKALCKQNHMQTLARTCQNMMLSCVPPSLKGHTREAFLSKLDDKLCSYLSCSMYWDMPKSEHIRPIGTALYIIAAMFLALSFLIYYYVVYAHFYTDESPLDIFAHDDAALSEQYESRNRSAIPGRARNRKRTAVTNRNSI